MIQKRGGAVLAHWDGHDNGSTFSIVRTVAAKVV
jgi:hypothetical protein